MEKRNCCGISSYDSTILWMAPSEQLCCECAHYFTRPDLVQDAFDPVKEIITGWKKGEYLSYDYLVLGISVPLSLKPPAFRGCIFAGTT